MTIVYKKTVIYSLSLAFSLCVCVCLSLSLQRVCLSVSHSPSLFFSLYQASGRPLPYEFGARREGDIAVCYAATEKVRNRTEQNRIELDIVRVRVSSGPAERATSQCVIF